MKLVVLIAAVLAVSLAADCNNPLLADATIKGNIGASNVAASVQTAASTLPICKWLAGKSVCASSYDTLKTSIDNQKAAFKTASDARNKARWGGIDTSINVDDCIKTAYFITMYITFSFSASISGSTTINYQSLSTSLQATWDAVKDSDEFKAQLALYKDELAKSDEHLEEFVSAKANCTAAVFDWVIYLNCLATDADYSSKVGGSGSSTQVYVKSGTCDTYVTKCKPYFTAASAVADFARTAVICNNDKIGAIVDDLEADWSDAVNTRLNTAWTSSDSDAELEAVFGSDGGQYNVNAFVGLSCGSTSSYDCDFICDHVLISSGAGIRTNAFLNLDGSVNNRRLQSTNGPAERSDGPDMFAQTANEDSSVEEDSSPIGGNGFNLFMSLTFLLGLVFAL